MISPLTRWRVGSNARVVLGRRLLCLRNAINIHSTANLIWWGYCSSPAAASARTSSSGVADLAGLGTCLTLLAMPLSAFATCCENNGDLSRPTILKYVRIELR